jgi:uncharacterized protein (TIGR03435 family)
VKSLRLAAVVALVTVTAVAAQDRPSSELGFEAASIRPSAPGGPPISGTTVRGNRLRGTKTTLYGLIRAVYYGDGLVSPQQFVGGPDWIRTEQWDINAVALGSPTRAEFTQMLRTLITERFKLQVRREQRELPVVALVLARDDGRLGSKLTSVQVDCAAYKEAFERLQSPLPAPGAPSQPKTCDRLTVARPEGTKISARAVEISDLAQAVTGYFGMPVMDRTGLKGQFDYDLEFVESPLADVSLNGVSIETALREQLGLRTERQRAPMDVLVIESAERPTPD